MLWKRLWTGPHLPHGQGEFGQVAQVKTDTVWSFSVLCAQASNFHPYTHRPSHRQGAAVTHGILITPPYLKALRGLSTCQILQGFLVVLSSVLRGLLMLSTCGLLHFAVELCCSWWDKSMNQQPSAAHPHHHYRLARPSFSVWNNTGCTRLLRVLLFAVHADLGIKVLHGYSAPNSDAVAGSVDSVEVNQGKPANQHFPAPII